MKCDFCKRFTIVLYEFEAGTGWYCKPECFLAAINEQKIVVKASQ